ncbi:MAG: hypothetical protein HC866_08500 [Leptolyngbyaceae cyanobacterium RU_5_1]|nr:hypothetical protein [Leptolyngbyaceae cyanobacterium RU_5_1]
MALLPPFVIVFDTTAILAGKAREWQEFSRLGECFVPEAVLEQMRAFCDRAPDPEIEVVAKEFERFYPTSGWRKTNALAEHPSLKPAEGHILSQRARLALEVLECAYGMAKRYPESLIVLVANDQPMLQRLLGLKTANLCGIPLPALVQWSRTQRRPPTVNHHLQLVRSPAGIPGEASTSRKSAPSAAVRTLPKPASMRTSTPALPKHISQSSSRPQRMARSRRVTNLLSNLISLVVAVIVGAAVWRVVHPDSFARFWQQLPFVSEPAQKPAPVKK